MNDEDIKLIEMPEHGSILVCVHIENDEIFQLGERINAKYEEAYMNGYNWDAVIRFYVAKVDPQLSGEIATDPEAGMFSANMVFSPENLEKMKRFEAHVRKLLSDEVELFTLIEENRDQIEWD